MTRLSSLFASIPYREGEQKPYETEWRNEMFLLLELIGENVQAEKHFASSRADCIVETEENVYIFEFKLDQSADDALRQIEEKGYAKPYEADRRKIYKIGVNFSSEKRNVEEWKTVGD